MMRINKQFILFMGIVFILYGCPSTARLYKLDTAEIIHLNFKIDGTKHGKITGKLPNGKELIGEYNILSGGSTSSGTSGANSVDFEEYAWATAQGFSFNEPNVKYGSATLEGDGLLIEIVYAVLAWTTHGYGVGRDNQGGRYRVKF
jgi:hypothetical protein